MRSYIADIPNGVYEAEDWFDNDGVTDAPMRIALKLTVEDETLEHWPKDSVLLDMVAIVRAFRPHAIIAVWTGTSADGHGHHQFAGVTAREVYDAAADSVRFPASRVGGLRPWATPKFYRGRWRASSTLSFNVGEYDPVAGKSYSEIASISRSQHRSQGQGELAERGARIDGVRLEASRVSDPAASERGLFDGLDTTWNRFRSFGVPDSARTALDSPAWPSAGSSKRVVDAVTPSMQARWPPAEAPKAPKRSGSRPYSAAFARRKRTAALTSSTAAGNRASPESR